MAEYFHAQPLTEGDLTSKHFFSVTEMPEKDISDKFGRHSVYSAIAESHKAFLRPTRLSKLMNIDSKEIVIRLMNKKQIKLAINLYTKASEVCQEISNEIDLQSSLDFKLFIYHSKEDIRVLHDDEYLLKALDLEGSENQNPEKEIAKAKEEKKSHGFFSNIKKNIENRFSKFKNDIKGLKIPS